MRLPDVRRVADHHIEAVEGEAHIWRVFCSCGYQVAAPFGIEHASKIAQLHLAAKGYAPTLRGALYQ